MNPLTLSAALLGLIWGCLFALFLQHTTLGHWLCNKRTWLTVVIGIGVDLMIMLLAVPIEYLINVTVVIALSSLGIIARSIANEHTEQRELEHIYDPAADERDQRP